MSDADRSDTADAPEVTAELPDAPFHTTGTDHVTIWGSNEAETLAFYRESKASASGLDPEGEADT